MSLKMDDDRIARWKCLVCGSKQKKIIEFSGKNGKKNGYSLYCCNCGHIDNFAWTLAAANAVSGVDNGAITESRVKCGVPFKDIEHCRFHQCKYRPGPDKEPQDPRITTRTAMERPPMPNPAMPPKPVEKPKAPNHNEPPRRIWNEYRSDPNMHSVLNENFGPTTDYMKVPRTSTPPGYGRPVISSAGVEREESRMMPVPDMTPVVREAMNTLNDLPNGTVKKTGESEFAIKPHYD
jgi:hypothetical protein